MATPVTVTTPDYTGVVDQSFFLSPLGGPQNPINYLDRFPEEVYNKGIDSHLVKFMYTLLGPAGGGWLRKNYLEARLKLEDFGLEAFDLDDFYGNPFAFGRILEEVYDQDPSGLIPREKWEEIRAKDAKYRNRALDFVNGARAGNTLLGMQLVARSGLGHEVEIVENYRFIYDQLSDDPLGLPKVGYTDSTEEMVVVPRREVPQNEVQVIQVTGAPSGGFFKLFFPVGDEAVNQSADIAYDASREVVRSFLESIPAIGPNNVRVTGGPLPETPIEVTFTGALGYRDTPQLQASQTFTGGTAPGIIITTTRSGTGQNDEVVAIGPRDQRYLRDALERIKPVTTIVSYGQARGLRSVQTFNDVFASSSYQEVIRYVAGQSGVPWPPREGEFWIERAVEHQAPRALNDLYADYNGFHNVADVTAYNEEVAEHPDYKVDLSLVPVPPNEHIGPFSQYQQALIPFLQFTRPYDYQYLARQAIADYAEPLTVRSRVAGAPMVNGIYPVSYSGLEGVPEVRYQEDQFWASVERVDGEDFIEIDLGRPQVVNYLYFEATRKPFDFEIAYDVLDLAPAREWELVTYTTPDHQSNYLSYDPSAQNPWAQIERRIGTRVGTYIFTRFLRIKFTRRYDDTSPYLAGDGSKLPYSIEVRNLRVGRNVSA